jgi:hypothetical protein
MIERANPLWVSLTPSVSFDNRAMCCFGATKNHRNDALWLGNYRRAGKKLIPSFLLSQSLLSVNVIVYLGGTRQCINSAWVK